MGSCVFDVRDPGVLNIERPDPIGWPSDQNVTVLVMLQRRGVWKT